MNRNSLRMAAVSAIAAVTLGGAAGLAQASEASAAPQTVAVTQQAQQAQARQAASALLASPLAAQLSPAEQAEMKQIANGDFTAASKWSVIKAAFSKVGGFAKAIAGKYSDFKKWYDGLSWWVKAPLAAVSPGLTILDIYNALH
ncbi:hypothetical protein [Streptomyces sp. NPDC001828]|uniref:hypothetical protein n=1 Tax=Streptomyces sp. NPDC001828 TaxID=3364615 RepID=UPI00369E0520